MEQKRELLRRRAHSSVLPSIVDEKVVLSPTEHDHARRHIVRRLLGLRFSLIVKVAVGVVTTLILMDVIYLANESLSFGDPCQIAENTKVQLSMSKRKLDKVKLLPLPKIIHQQWKNTDIPKGMFSEYHAQWKKLFPEPKYKHMSDPYTTKQMFFTSNAPTQSKEYQRIQM